MPARSWRLSGPCAPSPARCDPQHRMERESVCVCVCERERERQRERETERDRAREREREKEKLREILPGLIMLDGMMIGAS